MAYQTKNLDARNAYKRAWGKKARGFVKLAPEEYNRRQAACSETWRKANPDKQRAAQKAWKDANKESVRASIQRRKARLAKAKGDHRAADRIGRSEMFGRRCWLCEAAVASAMDHVFALCNGGTNWPANLRPACQTCNTKKGRWEMDGRKTLAEIMAFKIKLRDFGLKRSGALKAAE